MAYHVIKFEELPYADIDKYICVPESWIKWRNESKGLVIVAYPLEKPSRTQQRIENDEKYSRKWKCFLAKTEYSTTGRKEALNFIKYLNNKRNRGTEDSEKNQQNKEKASCSNTSVPVNLKTHNKETSDADHEVALNFIKYLNNMINRETEDSDKKQQNEEKTSCSNTKVPVDLKTNDNESSDADTLVLSDLEKDECETTDGNTSVPVDLKINDNESSDDDDSYVPSDFVIDESEATDDYASSDESEITLSPSSHKPSVQSRRKTKIILPPEYDPDFPRWSLKYPESNYRGRMDLVELRPGGKKTGIYVDRRGCDKCFEISATDNSLARNLMMEIFTKNALRVCTLTGKVPAGFEGDESEIRPGLYVHAVNALVQTVLLHGSGHNEESTIRSCLSAKLYHLRYKL